MRPTDDEKSYTKHNFILELCSNRKIYYDIKNGRRANTRIIKAIMLEEGRKLPSTFMHYVRGGRGEDSVSPLLYKYKYKYVYKLPLQV